MRYASYLMMAALACACGKVTQGGETPDASQGMPDAGQDTPDAALPGACDGANIRVIEDVEATTTMGECCGALLPAMLDGSGLEQDGLHDCGDATTWKSNNTTSGQVIFDLDDVYELYELRIWNHGQLGGDRGVKDIQIFTAPADGAPFAPLPNGPMALRKALTCPVPAEVVRIVPPVKAQLVRFDISSSHGAANTGLAEVQFSGVECDD